MNKVDRNFAPIGYQAMATLIEDGCDGCAFENDACGIDLKCLASERPDKQEVIFVKAK